MSHSYDVMAKVWATLRSQMFEETRDGEVAERFEMLISEMHEANHRHGDCINKDRQVNRIASKLDEVFTRYMSDERTKVFVYGTLKSGYGNHVLLRQGGAQFIRNAEAPGIVYGPFPFAKPSDNPADWIKGELYSVGAALLGRLDRLEGHPSFYTRTEVKLRSGERAHIYYSARPIIDGAPCPGNEWKGIPHHLREEESKRDD